MKICLTLAAAALASGGCSATGPTEPDFETAARYDIEKIREVNKEAHNRNVDVIWVNLPQAKRTLRPLEEEQTTE